MMKHLFGVKSDAPKVAGRRWPLRLVYAMLLIALLADLLANDKPLACRMEGQWYFPVFRQLLVDAGLGQWPPAQSLLSPQAPPSPPTSSRSIRPPRASGHPSPARR